MRPWELMARDSLRFESSVEANVVQSDDRPGNEHASTGKHEKPVEDCQRIITESHVCHACNCCLQNYADPWDTPLSGLEEDFWSLVLECEAVEDPCASEHGLIGRGPGGCEHDGVDDRADGFDAGAVGGKHKGTCCGVAEIVVEVGVVGGN